MKYKNVIIFIRNECVVNLHNTNEEIEKLLLNSPVVSVINGKEQVIGMVEYVVYSDFENKFYGDVWIKDKYANEKFTVKSHDVQYDSGNAGGVVATGFVINVE